MTSAIHNRQAEAGKVIMFITHGVLVNTAGTRSVTLDMKANTQSMQNNGLCCRFVLTKGCRRYGGWMSYTFIPAHLETVSV